VPYDAVIVMNNVPFPYAEATGNALADYSDLGGGVVLTIASFVGVWRLRGRLADGGYMPFLGTDGSHPTSELGSFDATHPLMNGVSRAGGSLLAPAPLAPGATAVATWANGLPFVATKGRVVGVNAFVAFSGYWTGDLP